MRKLSPILWTKDLNGTIAFYENVLGFRGRSNFPNFVTLTRGNVELMFIVPQEEPEDCEAPDATSGFFPRPILTGSIFILMDQVDQFWEWVKDKATIKDPINNREYGMRDFSILDNNGYELVFAEQIANR